MTREMPVPHSDLALLSARVYDKWWDAQPVLHGKGWGIHTRVAVDDADAWVCTNHDLMAVAVVFRGTEVSRLHIRDIVRNFGIPSRWEGPGWAHSGYLRALRRLLPQVVSALGVMAASRSYDGYSTTVTGHSQGGSVATLFAALIGHRGRRLGLDGLVTFGAPRALTRSAAEAIRCPVTRYVNAGDPFQHWPFLAPGLTHPKGDEVVLPRRAALWRILSAHDPDGYLEDVLRLEGKEGRA